MGTLFIRLIFRQFLSGNPLLHLLSRRRHFYAAPATFSI